MKKTLLVIIGLIAVLSVVGIFDTIQKNKKAEALKSKTVVFYGEIKSIEDADGKSKFTVVGGEGSPEGFAGKTYSFLENDKIKVMNAEGKEDKISIFQVGDQIIIQHVGDIVEGDVNELTGDIVMAPYTAPTTTPTDTTTETEPTK